MAEFVEEDWLMVALVVREGCERLTEAEGLEV